MKNHKTDSKDTEAIAEASRRPNMKFAGIKTVEHQDIQTIHRVRDMNLNYKSLYFYDTHK